MSSTSAALLRPGVALGLYPQREDIRDSWLERTAADLVGRGRQRIYGRRPRTGSFVGKVEAASAGLGALSDLELDMQIRDIRRRLYGEGLEETLVARAFGLIREVASRQVGMRPFDVQLYGGWVMLRGLIAEMETGEGKTLTATLPAATAAFAGIPVHIVTVNDFLVTRDAQWMGPIYRALGLTVGTIVEQMGPEERRAAYACDIVYCTNKQLVFDYLKDRLVLGEESRPLHLRLEGLHKRRPRSERLLMRGLCFAIVDEADSVLVDEARTPLIISNASDTAEQERAFIQAISFARKMSAPRDFVVHLAQRRIELTDLGRAQLARLTRASGGVWAGVRRREELIEQALTALHLFELDKHYIVEDGSVQIVDEFTGRTMPDRSWERGLHQMIEAKEGCPISGQQETLARISYQRFFRRYLRLAGMTGTAREVARELWSVYRLNVVTVPTNRPTGRRALRDAVYATSDAKWRAIVTRIAEIYETNHNPILVGTRSVAASEHLSALLDEADIPHRVLNARQDQEEAMIISEAGELGQVTVATNMAGRGTDIRLGPLVADLGGLYVVATERHEARRIDRQLFGRCGRQGDPGFHQAIVCLDDELVRDLFGARVRQALQRLFDAPGPLPRWVGWPIVGIAQIAAERRHSSIRRRLLKIDDDMEDMLAFSGRAE